jgi:hypothetical protein
MQQGMESLLSVLEQGCEEIVAKIYREVDANCMVVLLQLQLQWRMMLVLVLMVHCPQH